MKYRKEDFVLQRNRRRRFRFCVLPGYNWCGPGCNGPGAPINAVDAACKAHDICYRKGRSPCECDQEFLCRLRPHIDSCTKEGRHARLLYHYIKMQTFITCNTFRW
ncbi:phospholipase [Sporosarcina sp. FSL K6-1522]|uniref:phospholipase n=1 Tax=Sporosarcina sp. FSL K6-1522 TaxID=2921554 RepID=UPI003159BE80